MSAAQNQSEASAVSGPQVSSQEGGLRGPPLPEAGLPAGWTQEQWEYYGQQYLDGTL